MSYFLGFVAFLCLLATGIIQYRMFESTWMQYEKSRKLFVENPDDFVRREAFFKDGYSYYRGLHGNAAYAPYTKIQNRLNLLNGLSRNRMNRHMHIGVSTKIGSQYYLSKSVQTSNTIAQIKTKILNVCSGNRSGSSIVDIIFELREDRIEIMPILAELQEENLIIPSNNAFEISNFCCRKSFF